MGLTDATPYLRNTPDFDLKLDSSEAFKRDAAVITDSVLFVIGSNVMMVGGIWDGFDSNKCLVCPIGTEVC